MGSLQSTGKLASGTAANSQPTPHRNVGRSRNRLGLVGNSVGSRFLPTAPCRLRLSSELRHELLLVRLHDKLACEGADLEIRRQQGSQRFHAFLHRANRW